MVVESLSIPARRWVRTIAQISGLNLPPGQPIRNVMQDLGGVTCCRTPAPAGCRLRSGPACLRRCMMRWRTSPRSRSVRRSRCTSRRARTGGRKALAATTALGPVGLCGLVLVLHTSPCPPVSASCRWSRDRALAGRGRLAYKPRRRAARYDPAALQRAATIYWHLCASPARRAPGWSSASSASSARGARQAAAALHARGLAV